MTPGEFQYRGQAYHSHRGIVEASVFLVRLVRPVIWRAMDAMKKEGIDPQSDLEVIFTGHSLGGATASIAALELQVCRQARYMLSLWRFSTNHTERGHGHHIFGCRRAVYHAMALSPLFNTP